LERLRFRPEPGNLAAQSAELNRLIVTNKNTATRYPLRQNLLTSSRSLEYVSCRRIHGFETAIPQELREFYAKWRGAEPV
jgi:hypothetical protein